MVARVIKLKGKGVGGLIRWAARADAGERFEVSAERAPSLAPDFVSGGEESLNYLSREGIPLEWSGTGAQHLGLIGAASAPTAARVLQHGIGPQGQALQTGQEADHAQERVRAYGVVWSAPKTVSLLLASPDLAVRESVQIALRIAADAYLATLESQLTVRRGKAGIRSEKIAGLIAVRALHQTTSAGDPHLHCHWIVAASAASSSDGAYRALDGRMLFQAQKLAEARANRVLREVLQDRLDITAWTLEEAGSAPFFEIIALEEAVETFSQARSHMQAIATELGVPFALRSRKMDARLWREHRERKAEVAEALEHKMDESLHQNADAAVFIRESWAAVLESAGAGDALRALCVRPEKASSPIDTPEAASFAVLEEDRAALMAALEPMRPAPEDLARAEACRTRNPGGRTALEVRRNAVRAATGRVIHIQAAIGIGSAKARLAEVAEQERAIDAEIAAFDQAQTVLERTQQADHLAARLQEIDAAREQAGSLLRALTETLGPFTPADVVARLTVEGRDITDSQKGAAYLLRYWTRIGAVQWREGMDAEAVCAVLERSGFSTVTADLHQMARTRSLIPDALIQREIALARTAKALSAERRTGFVIPIPKTFTQEQAQAAACLAQGRALSVTVGVAGAGKTFLAQPIVAAAQRQGSQVRVLARNRALAETLREELHSNDAQVFATFDPERDKDQKTLLIVDEAGLADQADLQAILTAVAHNSRWQAWLIGDRAQAQPIDRLGSFAVVEQAVVPGALSRLDTSYRCAAWSAEHAALRALQNTPHPAPAVEELVARLHQAGRLITVDPEQPEVRPAHLAEWVEQYRAQGEDVLAITRDNASAAALAEYLQAHRGIAIDPRTELRFEQKAGVGDQVRTRRNDRRLGVRNGDLWTVRAVDIAGTITLQSVKNPHRSVRLPKDYTQDALELAYAATADAAQGITVDRAVVDTTGMGRSLLYSAATRSRQAPVLLVAADPAESPEKALSAVLLRDDVVHTMRELLGPQRQALLAQSRILQESSGRIDALQAIALQTNTRRRAGWSLARGTGQWTYPDAAYLQPELAQWQRTQDRFERRVAAAQALESSHPTTRITPNQKARILSVALQSVGIWGEQHRPDIQVRWEQRVAERRARAEAARRAAEQRRLKREQKLTGYRTGIENLIRHYEQVQMPDDPETEKRRWQAVGYEQIDAEREPFWRKHEHPHGAMAYHPETFALHAEQKRLEAVYAPLAERRATVERLQEKTYAVMWTWAHADTRRPWPEMPQQWQAEKEAAQTAGVPGEVITRVLETVRERVNQALRREHVRQEQAASHPAPATIPPQRLAQMTLILTGALMERAQEHRAQIREQWKARRERAIAACRQGIGDAIARVEQAGSVDSDSLDALWEQAGWVWAEGQWTHPYKDALTHDLDRLNTAYDALEVRWKAAQREREELDRQRQAIAADIAHITNAGIVDPETFVRLLEHRGCQRDAQGHWSHERQDALADDLDRLIAAYAQMQTRYGLLAEVIQTAYMYALPIERYNRGLGPREDSPRLRWDHDEAMDKAEKAGIPMDAIRRAAQAGKDRATTDAAAELKVREDEKVQRVVQAVRDLTEDIRQSGGWRNSLHWEKAETAGFKQVSMDGQLKIKHPLYDTEPSVKQAVDQFWTTVWEYDRQRRPAPTPTPRPRGPGR
ncbi:MAG: relaxase domain-containing protein [Betaproteobacteria bacterium]|jgi:conjugative relaxase-like TrwC/TraI family protein|nr:relaxase domain-containing protein [Betaproteobacteria bacterium]